ncbi:hypothetical protein HMSLTHF_02060 [Vreelandella aquamarina]|uniref:Uncharacterized protein n=1 Tax=Vreelandella aquamarina TaxID=77097 RepID=A0A6F8SQ65_9GAMM|nr:hypothetical protein HMSLTHF_02060 [Halomonas meridiana]
MLYGKINLTIRHARLMQQPYEWPSVGQCDQSVRGRYGNNTGSEHSGLGGALATGHADDDADG